MNRFLPFLDLGGYSREDGVMDLQAALAVTFLSVPQGVAYAVIAGLPPAMGLYAGALPAIVGALLRSSKHVVVGPSNAVSLLVGTAVAAQIGDPVLAAGTLALMVGAFQLAAGLLSLGGLVDYISSAVVSGYITGAAALIAIGQLGNLTASQRGHGSVLAQIVGWLRDLGHADPRAVALGVGTVATMAVIDRRWPRVPSAIVAMVVGIGLSWAFDLGGSGLPLLRDIHPIPTGLPPLTLPELGQATALLPAAFAIAMLSLLESAAVARSTASVSGERLDPSADFAGQGLANLAAAFTGGYPVSGSLARTALNQAAGSRTRMSGALAGAFVLLTLLFLGPIVDLTPVSVLAGVVLITAAGLVDLSRIKRILRSDHTDLMAFVATLIGTWVLSLDKAIYLGVAISLVLFLRRARLLTVRELGVDEGFRLREQDGEEGGDFRLSPAVRVVHVEGSLFFGASNELRDALEAQVESPEVQALVVRLKRAYDLDYTTATVLEALHERLEREGRQLYLVGMRPRMMEVLDRTGVTEAIGADHLFPTRSTWFEAMDAALTAARAQVAPTGADVAHLDAYLDAQKARQSP